MSSVAKCALSVVEDAKIKNQNLGSYLNEFSISFRSCLSNLFLVCERKQSAYMQMEGRMNNVLSSARAKLSKARSQSAAAAARAASTPKQIKVTEMKDGEPVTTTRDNPEYAAAQSAAAAAKRAVQYIESFIANAEAKLNQIKATEGDLRELNGSLVKIRDYVLSDIGNALTQVNLATGCFSNVIEAVKSYKNVSIKK